MRNLFKQQRGFTLVEALFQLFVLVIITQLLMSHQLAMRTYMKTFYSDDVYWEMFAYEMQRYIDAHEQPFRVVYNEKITRTVYKPDTGKAVEEAFTVTTNYNAIHRQFDGGHEVLLYNVKKLYVTIERGVLMMRVTFLNDDVRERVFYVPT